MDEKTKTNNPKHAAQRLANPTGTLRSKELGDLGELAFVLAASAMGLPVAKPFGDCRRYDLIVDSGRRMLRIQVKSVFKRRENGNYQVKCCSHAGPGSIIYTSREIDFMAIYLAAIDIWYLIPVAALLTNTVIHLHPDGLRREKREGWAKFEIYKEAWNLLNERLKT
jgi:hypothetical protein